MAESRGTMDFFEHQQTAKRKTALLLFYYLLTFPVITTLVYIAYVLAASITVQHHDLLWSAPQFLGIGAIVSVVILAGTAYHVITLSRGGGEAVCQMLGAEAVSSATADENEKRFLNVLEEISIASGVPVPRAFVLRNETGINAFAAGLSRDQAVVAVTRGTLEQLSREELQGVIAHEFSHILNGDMTLNARLLGIIGGITIISLVGRGMMKLVSSGSSSRRSGGQVRAALFVSGLLLFVAGWVGTFFGQIIRSAVSRQREFLADASAVQFTRNPSGIAGALRKIMNNETGSIITSSRAEEASHFFFANGLTGMFASWFATHPPLVERIRRIDPSVIADGVINAAPLRREETGKSAAFAPGAGETTATGPGAAVSLTPERFVKSMGAVQNVHVETAKQIIAGFPAEVCKAAGEPYSGRAVIYGLLIDGDAATRAKQMADMEKSLDNAELPELQKLMPFLEALGPEERFAIIDLATSSLRNLSLPQYQRFRDKVSFLVAADSKLSLFEYSLQWSLITRLDRAFKRMPPAKVRYRTVYELEMDLFGLLTALAWIGSDDAHAAQRALDSGTKQLGSQYAWSVGERKVDLTAMDRTLRKIGDASPEVKKMILQACVAAIGTDGRVTPDELSLLRAIAGAMDCPVPPVSAGTI